LARPAALGLAQALQPDVVLLDAEMPDLRLRDAVGLLRTRSPSSRVVALSLDPIAVARSLGGGAATPIGKHEGTAGLLAAVRGGGR
jgi:DNA-binding NarL/FixJ family response regulator